MDFSTTLRATAATFFIAINLLVCIKTDTDVDTISISSPLKKIFPTLSTIDIEPLPEGIFGHRISNILSPDIFLQSDPLAHLLTKVTRNAYNGEIETLEFINIEFKEVRFKVDSFLRSRKFPRPYVLYAKFLSSLLCCLIKLKMVAKCTSEIRLKYSNESEYPPPPSDILTPELRALFSNDIFSDSNIPSAVLKELLKISDDEIPDVVKDLDNLSGNHDYTDNPYYHYMRWLRVFFGNGHDLFILRYEEAEIRRRISNLNGNLSNSKVGTV